MQAKLTLIENYENKKKTMEKTYTMHKSKSKEETKYNKLLIVISRKRNP